VQLTSDWDILYRTNATAWEDAEISEAAIRLITQHLPPRRSILELGCGRGVDALWLARNGYTVAACDVSPTAIQEAREHAQQQGLQIDFFVADILSDPSTLPRCDAIYERGLLHTLVTDEGRARCAGAIAGLLDPGNLWLSIAGAAATRSEADDHAKRRQARISLSQIAGAVEPHFDILSVTRTRYGPPGGKTDFPAFASVFRRRYPDLDR
jgi:SAM-dependent methyltransferase